MAQGRLEAVALLGWGKSVNRDRLALDPRVSTMVSFVSMAVVYRASAHR